MRLFRRSAGREPDPARVGDPDPKPARGPGAVRVSRTLVKSEPELAELVAADPRLGDEGIEITLAEKGFGTRVAIVADARGGLSETDLEALLDRLAEPQKRPFSNG